MAVSSQPLAFRRAYAPRPMTPHFRTETRFHRDGLWPLAGVDEVGRGPLAGPVVAAAVILDPTVCRPGSTIRKRCGQSARGVVRAHRRARAAIGVACASVERNRRHQHPAGELCSRWRGPSPRFLAPGIVLVDGNDPPALACPGEAIVKGDALSLSIAAASIVAKVMRDRKMAGSPRSIPYGFETNAGYGTRAHLAALRARSVAPAPDELCAGARKPRALTRRARHDVRKYLVNLRILNERRAEKGQQLTSLNPVFTSIAQCAQLLVA